MFKRYVPFIRNAFGPSPESIRLIIEGPIMPKLLYCSPIIEQHLDKVTVKKTFRKVHRKWLIKAYGMFPTASYLRCLSASSSRSVEEMVITKTKLYKMKREKSITLNVIETKHVDVRKLSQNIPPWHKNDQCRYW